MRCYKKNTCKELMYYQIQNLSSKDLAKVKILRSTY